MCNHSSWHRYLNMTQMLILVNQTQSILSIRIIMYLKVREKKRREMTMCIDNETRVLNTTKNSTAHIVPAKGNKKKTKEKKINQTRFIIIITTFLVQMDTVLYFVNCITPLSNDYFD